MTSFNDILNDIINDNINDSIIDYGEKTDVKTDDDIDILFILDENIPKEKLVQNEIHYLDSNKLYTPKRQLGEYTLKTHQQTTLYYMLGLEKMLFDVKTLKADNTIDHTNHYTDIGILSDQVGAGKSYCIMALLNESKTIIPKHLAFRNNYIGSSNITPIKINKLNRNILLVPHSLIGQWSKYLEKSGLRYYTIQKSKDVYGIADNKCKFKNCQDDEKEVKDEVKPKPKSRKKTKTETEIDPKIEIETKPKKKISLKKKSEPVLEPVLESVLEPVLESVPEPITRKSKSDKKKELDISRRRISSQITEINNQIHMFTYHPDYRYITGNINEEREIVQNTITELRVVLKNLDADYLEISNLIKNFDLENGIVSSGQINLLNEYNTLFNVKNSHCYNPNYVCKDLQNFLVNMSHIDKTYVESLDVILVSDTFYNFFSLYLTKDNYTVNRIIIDECNSIKATQLFTIKTIFTWLVTSSVNSLMTNSGCIYKQQTSPQGYTYNVREKTIMSTGFVLNTICRLYENKDNFKLYLINNPDYIKQSILLPELKTFIIVCKDNVIIQVLNGIVSNDIMRMLNAGDVEGIITRLDAVVGDESNIISIITQKYNDDLLIKEYELKVAIENPKYKPETESLSIIHKRSAIKDLKYKITCIEDRIKNADSCPICIDDFINPVITPCCNNKYCFNCITLSLNNKNSCPSCRNVINMAKLLVVSDKIKTTIPTVHKSDIKSLKSTTEILTYTEKIEYLKSVSLNLTKYENMNKILELNNK